MNMLRNSQIPGQGIITEKQSGMVAAMLKSIHAQEDFASAKEKALAVATNLLEIKLKEAATKVEKSIEETLVYMHPRSIG
jgi:hypothetical protein